MDEAVIYNLDLIVQSLRLISYVLAAGFGGLVAMIAVKRF